MNSLSYNKHSPTNFQLFISSTRISFSKCFLMLFGLFRILWQIDSNIRDHSYFVAISAIHSWVSSAQVANTTVEWSLIRKKNRFVTARLSGMCGQLKTLITQSGRLTARLARCNYLLKAKPKIWSFGRWTQMRALQILTLTLSRALCWVCITQ